MTNTDVASADVTTTDVAPVVLSNGRRCWVPHNRWDLVDHVHASTPTSCAVIVPYFEQPDSLRRMYAAIAVADLDPDRYELIVVDDGSREPPPSPPADFPIPTMILRQGDLGCRPGAARHLGAGSTLAESLVFLDSDTLPSPGTIERFARWATTLPDALVVGARHHVDIDGWSPDRTARWLTGSGEHPPQRPDPAWLADAYDTSRDLLDADDRSYRFVISGVMACSRALYEDAGGFDVTRDQYGTEDWDLASRCYNAGALMIHDRLAIAWHDEPDWNDREDKRAEAARRESDARSEQWAWLSDRVSDPAARGRGVVHSTQSLIARFRFDDASDAGPEGEIVAIDSMLASHPDTAIFMPSSTGRLTRGYVRSDPRVRFGEPSPDETCRARAVIDVHAPIDWTAAALCDLVDRVAPGGSGSVSVLDGERCLATVTSTRAAARVRRALRYGIDAEHAMRSLFGIERVAVADIPSLHVLHGPIGLAGMFDRPRARRSAP